MFEFVIVALINASAMVDVPSSESFLFRVAAHGITCPVHKKKSLLRKIWQVITYPIIHTESKGVLVDDVDGTKPTWIKNERDFTKYLKKRELKEDTKYRTFHEPKPDGN